MRASTTSLTLLLLLVPTTRFSVDGRHNAHARITREALDFIRPALQDVISDANRGEDKGASYDFPERHFTNCLFRESVAYINHRYRWSVAALAQTKSRVAAQQFGMLLHTAQDFYSHSAWVDPLPIGLGNGGPRGPLIEQGTSAWSLPAAYQQLADDVVIIQGDPPEGVTIDLPRDSAGRPASAVPVVIFGGKRQRGLMTTTAGPISFATAQCPPAGSDCWSPETVCIRHAEPRREPDGQDEIARCLKQIPEIYENCFHHDYPRRPRYEVAVAAALRQTAHEWCRLLQLTNRADTSGRAVGLLLALWVLPDAELGRFASPHPLGTPCAPQDRGTTAVTLQLPALQHDSADHYVATLYTDDLRRSTRLQFQRGAAPARALTLCVGARDNVRVSIWGWKGGDEFDPNDAVLPVRSDSLVVTRSSPC